MTPDSHHSLFERAEPRPDFRAELRRAFVAGDGAFAADAPRREPSTEARLRAVLLTEEAPGAFAATLRTRFTDFVDGMGAAPVAPPVVPTDTQTGAPILEFAPAARGAGAPTRSWRSRLAVVQGWRFAAALAAALLVVLTANWWFDRAPTWTVFNQTTAIATVDGERLSDARLRPGERPCELCATDVNLRLGYENLLRIELAKDSLIKLPCPRVGEDGRVTASFSIERGEIVCVTLGDARLAMVVIETPMALVNTSGAAVSVIPNPSGSVCICVGAGSVTVTSRSGDGSSVVVVAGQRALVRPDGTVAVATDDAGERRLRNLAQARDDVAGDRFDVENYSRAWNVLDAY